jgi:PAS domain S-box-containing protein
VKGGHGAAFAPFSDRWVRNGGLTTFPSDADLLDRLIDTAPVPIIVVALDGTVVIWNRAAEQLFGWSASEAVGKPNPIVPPELRLQSAELSAALARGERRMIETRRLARDGRVIDVMLTAAGIRDASGGFELGIGILQDLTEFRAVQSRARVAEERAHALLEAVSELAILFLDRDMNIADANRGAELLLGWSAEELRQRGLSSILETALLDPEQPVSESWCLQRDGRRFWAEAVLTPVHDLQGALTGAVLLLRDVTTRKREHERERRRSQQGAAVTAFAQRATREISPDAVVEAAVEHAAAALQADYTEILGRSAGGRELEAVQAFGWGRTFHPAARVDPEAPTIYAEALAQRGVVMRELRASDFQHAPHLRDIGATWGAVMALRMDGELTTLGAFARNAFTEADIYPLQSIGTMSEAIAARRIAEQQLAQRDRTLSLTLDQMPAILSTFDRNLRFTSVRGAGLPLLRGGRSELEGRTLTEVIGGSGGLAYGAIQAALAGKSSSYVNTFSGRSYDNHVEPLRDPEGEIVGAVNLGIDVTDRRRDEEALSSSREELRRLSARLNALQEEERRRIAHELHDELGQRLTALRMEASLLPHKLGRRGTPAAAAAIEGMISLIDETIVTVRRVATELRPAILDDFGCRAAIELELAALKKRAGIDYALQFNPEELPIRGELATVIYRIVQESLTNVARHAQATFVDVSVSLDGSWIVVEIADNGRGITEAELAGSSALGLLGIRERAYAHGGDADVHASTEGGTVVSVRLPAGGR